MTVSKENVGSRASVERVGVLSNGLHAYEGEATGSSICQFI